MVLDSDTDELLEYRHLMKDPKHKEICGNSFGNEVGRLAQSMHGRFLKENATNTKFFFKQDETPMKRRRDVTYAQIVCNCRDEKKGKEKTRITMGGDRTNCPFDCVIPTVELLTVKLLLSIVISIPGAKFMTTNISNFCLNTTMDRYKYMRMKLDMFPDDVIEEYNLCDKVEPNGYVYIKVHKSMYGLLQAGLLTQELLTKQLAKHCYKQSDVTPGLWIGECRPICFSLVIDGFGVEYVGREHAAHLVSALKEIYELEVDT